jgi:hypothetical protein
MYPRIVLFEKMPYRRIRIGRIPIHVSVSMPDRLWVLDSATTLSFGVVSLDLAVANPYMRCPDRGFGGGRFCFELFSTLPIVSHTTMVAEVHLSTYTA